MKDRLLNEPEEVLIVMQSLDVIDIGVYLRDYLGYNTGSIYIDGVLYGMSLPDLPKDQP